MNASINNPTELVNKIEEENKKKNYLELIRLCEQYFLNYSRQESVLMLWANAKHQLGLYDESIPAAAELVDRFPDKVEYKFNYAWMLQCNKESDKARFLYEEILLHDPTNPGANVNYANMLSSKGNMCEAIKLLSRLTASGKAPAEAFNNIGSFLKNIGENEQAINAYLIAVMKDPKYIDAYYNLCMAMSYSNKTDVEVFEIHKIVGSMLEAGVNPIKPGQLDKNKNKFNIGYVSGDFRKHAVANFLMPVILNHNKDKFNIYCYSTTNLNDEVTEIIKNNVESYNNLTSMTDVEAAENIKKDNIDILIDLSGYTANSRLSIFAFRPAPIQVTWLGYVATTGMKSIDWRLVDRHTEQMGIGEAFNVEKLYRLPNTFSVFLPPPNSPDIKDLPYLKNGYLTFGSFNYFGKVNNDVIKLWAQVLIKVKNSRLILKANSLGEPLMISRIQDKFKLFNIDPVRIIFRGKAETYESHMDMYNEVDIALDTFPYSGATTTCEALWMGVPVIVRETTRMRIGVSMAHNSGFSDLIALSDDEYVDIALNLSKNIPRLNDIRKNMRENLINTDLFNCKKFTTELEDSFIDMIRLKYHDKSINDVSYDKTFQSIDILYDKAIHLFKNNNFLEAEGIFRKIIAFEPTHVNSLLYLSHIYEQKNNLNISIGYLEKVSLLEPNNSKILHKIGLILHKQGRNKEAVDSLEKSISIEPNEAQVYSDCAVVLDLLKKDKEAESCFKKSLEVDPSNYISWFNYGNYLNKIKRYSEASKCFIKSLEIKPNHYKSINNLAMSYFYEKKLMDSAKAIEQLIKLDSENPEYINNLANVYSAMGKDIEALKLILPVMSKNLNNLPLIITSANIFQKLNKLSEASNLYEQALIIDGSNVIVLTNYGNCLKSMGFYLKAKNMLERSISIDSENIDAYINLASLAKDSGDIDKAMQCYGSAVNLTCEYSVAHSGLCMASLYSDLNSNQVFELHSKIGKLIEQKNTPYEHINIIKKDKIRVGYISADFRNHAVSFFLLPVIKRHNKKLFEIFLFSNNQINDSITDEFISYADKWIDINKFSDSESAAMIRNFDVDILVDLSGHTAYTRIGIFAFRPSPIQATWLGYISSTGLSRIDWRIVDPYIEVDNECNNSEKLYALRNTFCVYEPPNKAPDINEAPCIKNGYITFGSFNSLAKLNNEVISLWARVLGNIGNSKLLLKTFGLNEDELTSQLLLKFSKLGINSSRIVLLNKTNSVFDHLDLYNQVDICLDTFPYPGVTTTCEALWMGVPVIVLDCSRMSISKSILINSNLTEFIASSDEEYIEITKYLSENTQILIELRSNLRQNLIKSNLFDYENFVVNLEDAFLQMIHCHNENLEI